MGVAGADDGGAELVGEEFVDVVEVAVAGVADLDAAVVGGDDGEGGDGAVVAHGAGDAGDLIPSDDGGWAVKEAGADDAGVGDVGGLVFDETQEDDGWGQADDDGEEEDDGADDFLSEGFAGEDF